MTCVAWISSKRLSSKGYGNELRSWTTSTPGRATLSIPMAPGDLFFPHPISRTLMRMPILPRAGTARISFTENKVLEKNTFWRRVMLWLSNARKWYSGRGYFRPLQRKTRVAIVFVRHARKNVSTSGGTGYSLRGSSDLYAWVDSFFHLRRHHAQLLLSAE